MLIDLVDSPVNRFMRICISNWQSIPIVLLLIFYCLFKLMHSLLSNFNQFLNNKLSDFLHNGVQINS